MKILLMDLETFPNQAFVWGKYDQNVIRFMQQTCICTFVAKWLGEKRVIAKSLPHYAGYLPGSYDDKALVHDLWKLFDEADVLVAHNGIDFDVKVANARFLKHGFGPPSPFKTICTKREMKKVARVNSNRLDDLGEYFNFGRKIKTDFDLWQGCIEGQMKSWRTMLRYNVKDVILLEKLYLRLRPWMKTHPNAGIDAACPKCGSKKIQWRGLGMSSTTHYRKFQCQSCNGWGRAVRSEKRTNVTNA
jgi:RNase_H superfamily